MTIQPPLPGFAAVPATRISCGLETLFHYPRVSGATLSRHAPLVGRAGESLVDSLLQRHGVHVLRVDDARSDRLMECDGALVGLQVKTTTHPDAGGTYRFQVRMGCNARGAGRRGYAGQDFDVTALVVLPENIVRFTASRAECHSIRSGEIAALRAAPIASLKEALAAYDLHFGPLGEEGA